MKWVVVGPVYPWRGGIAHHNALFIAELRKRNQAVAISYHRMYPRLLFPGQSSRDPSENAIHTDACYILDGVNPLTWLNAATRIARLRPDVVLFHWWHWYWAPMTALMIQRIRRLTRGRTKFIFDCHNVLPHETHFFDPWFVRLAFVQGDAFIVHAKANQDLIHRLIPGSNVKVLTYPLYTLPGEKPEQPAARSKLTIPEDAHVLLFFGYVRPYKGLEYLIQALQIARRNDLKLHLLVAGEFWIDKGELNTQIEQCGLAPYVTLIDRYIPNEEVGTYFSAADVVVLPYVHSWNSGIIHLAYDQNVPVIATNIGDLPAVIEDGKVGLIVPPADAQALADAIDRFFRENLSTPFIAEMQARRSDFTWASYIDELEALVCA